MDDEKNLNEVNDELIEKAQEYLELSNSISEKNDELISQANERLGLQDTLNEKVEEEKTTEETIRDTVADTKYFLGEIVDKKTIIRDTNDDINTSENEIRDHLRDERGSLDTIVTLRENEAQNVGKTVVEQEKLYGFTTNVLRDIQNALTAQQALNAAIASGASITPPSPTGGGGSSSSGGSGTGSGGSGAGGGGTSGSGSTSPNSGATSPFIDGKQFSKANIAVTAIQGSIELIKKYGQEAIDKWIEIDERVYTTTRQMGVSTSQMRGMQRNILANYGEMANRLGMTFEEIFKFQESYTQSVGRSVVLTNKQVESFAGLSKIMGETAVNTMAENMDAFGASSQAAIDHLTLGMARAASQGLNIKTTSEKFAQNIKMASMYTFSKGIDGVNKMTLLSQKLKFNMESIGSAIDKFSTIEGAISTSANLQVLGGAYAANYSNPMQAMGEALLDAEGFTQRIVDTVSRTAQFDRESGTVEMSPYEKARLREASKQLGIDYNELWNMASQQAKIRDVDRFIGGKNFSEEEKAFIANTAQYDAETQRWTVTKMNEKTGEQEEVDISDLNTHTIKEIQKENDVEKFIQGDVHSIRKQLENYLGTTVEDTKTFKEIFTGQEERMKIDMADIIDPVMSPIKEFFKGMGEPLYGTYRVTKDILKWLIGSQLGNLGVEIGKGLASPASATRRGGRRAITRGALKVFGRTGTKILTRSVPIVGTALSIGMGAYDVYEATRKHNENVKQITQNTRLSDEEKDALIKESKRERNENVGGAVGGTSGALAGMAAGAAIGSVVPVVGTAIGGIIGGIAGYFGGDALGRGIGKRIEVNGLTKETPSRNVNTTNTTNTAVSSYSVNNGISSASTATSIAATEMTDYNTENYSNEAVFNTLSSSDRTLRLIQEDVRAIRTDTVSNVDKFNYSLSIEPYKQYDTKTYIKETLPYNSNHNNFNQQRENRLKVDRIDVNVSGTLKVQGGNNSKNIDLNELFNTPEFKRMLIDKINEGFARNGNAVQSRSLDSTQSIMGGYYTPNSLNSRN